MVFDKAKSQPLSIEHKVGVKILNVIQVLIGKAKISLIGHKANIDSVL